MDDVGQLVRVDGGRQELSLATDDECPGSRDKNRGPREGSGPSDKTGPQTAKAGWGPVVFLQKREENHARAIRTDWERTIGDSYSRSSWIWTPFVAWHHLVQVVAGTISSIRQVSVTAPATTTYSTRTSQHCFFRSGPPPMLAANRPWGRAAAGGANANRSRSVRCGPEP
jgi:hypothetical protein